MLQIYQLNAVLKLLINDIYLKLRAFLHFYILEMCKILTSHNRYTHDNIFLKKITIHSDTD